MKVFLDPFHTIENEAGERLDQLLTHFGIQVVNELTGDEQGSESIHLFFLDASYNTSENAFIAALAIAQKKQIICFLKKGKQLPASLSVLNTNPALQKQMKLIYYTPKNLSSHLKSLIKQLDSGQLKEKPSIKFTLRITPTIDRYLEWKSKQLQESKADFLRKTIQETIIDQDKDYHQMVD